MKRRALLASVAAGTAGLAGCGEFGDGSPDRGNFGVPEDGEDGSGSVPAPETPPGLARGVDSTVGPRRRLVVSALPDYGTPEGTRVTAGFVSAPTADSPPRLWIALTNVTDEPRTLSFGPTPPFSGYFGREITWGSVGDVRLTLVPDDDRKYADYPLVLPDSPRTPGTTSGPGDGTTIGSGNGTTGSADDDRTATGQSAAGRARCWQAQTVFVGRSKRLEVTLAPGESVSGEYAVLWYHGLDACPPRRGGYRFENAQEGVGLVVSTWDPALAIPGSPTLDRRVPELPGPDATVWFHRVEDAAVYLSPGRERLELPRDEVTVTLQNFSSETIPIAPDDLSVYHLRDGEWRPVVDDRPDTASNPVPPGGGSRHLVRFGSGDAAARGTPIPDPDPGLYAIRHGTTGGLTTDRDGPLAVGNDEDGPRSGVTYATLVELVEDGGDPADGSTTGGR